MGLAGNQPRWEQMEKTHDCCGLRETSALLRRDGQIMLKAWEPVSRLGIFWRCPYTWGSLGVGPLDPKRGGKSVRLVKTDGS